MYTGVEEVKGILCDAFLRCKYDTTTNTNTTFKYYFSSRFQKISSKIHKSKLNVTSKKNYKIGVGHNMPGVNGAQFETIPVRVIYTKYTADAIEETYFELYNFRTIIENYDVFLVIKS